MLLRDFLFAMLIISAVILGFGGIWTDMAVKYSVPAPTRDISAFNQINKTLSIANSLQNNQTGIAAMLQSIPIAGSFASVLIAGTQVLTVMLQIPDIFSSMFRHGDNDTRHAAMVYQYPFHSCYSGGCVCDNRAVSSQGESITWVNFLAYRHRI